MTSYQVGTRNRVRQAPQRARYDRSFIHEVLDAAYVAHVAFVDDDEPFVLPLYYARDGEGVIKGKGERGSTDAP